MSKRRGADDENSSPVSSKRARIENGSDLENSESEHIPRSQRNKGKGKARAVSEDIDSDDEDQELEKENDGDLDEEEFEEKYGPRIEESWAAKQGVVGVSFVLYLIVLGSTSSVHLFPRWMLLITLSRVLLNTES